MNKWLFPKLWQNICFEETVCFYTDENGIKKGGSLLYEPLKIKSMTSWDENVQFTENIDFVIEGNVIKRLKNSKIPLLQFDMFSHTNDGNPLYQWLYAQKNILRKNRCLFLSIDPRKNKCLHRHRRLYG